VRATGRLTIAGAIAQKPQQAGHAWQYLQYLLGFRRLGWDVLFVDQLDAGGRNAAGVAWLDAVMRDHGLADSWSLAAADGCGAGLPRERVLEHVRDSDLLINVMGFLGDEEILAAAPRRVFLDTDPGFGQMWRAQGLADIFAGHDDHVTIGERIGEPDCTVPDCGLRWITTPQPVVLSAWPVQPLPQRGPFTSVGRWRGAYGPIDHRGRRYGLRVHEFRKFARLPLASGGRFELALDIDGRETADLELLGSAGWTLVDPLRAAGSLDSYRAFIARSGAEFSVAKGMYVESGSGWFSERSICYLASGRPVLAQDTGFARLLPTGEGLVAFRTLDEAAAGVEAVLADPDRHACAARALAEEHFDSDKVLTRLLDQL